MTSSHEQIKKDNEPEAKKLRNNAEREDLIRKEAANMADIDEQRAKLNKQAGRSRERLKEAGIEIDAFQSVYQYHKKRRHEQEGYDDSFRLCEIALNNAETGELFAWQDSDKPKPKEKKPEKNGKNPPAPATAKPDVGQEQAKIIEKSVGAAASPQAAAKH